MHTYEAKIEMLTQQVDQRDTAIEIMRKSYDDRIAKLKDEVERQREINKALLTTNNALQSRLYDDSQVDSTGIVGELVSEKATHLIAIDELRAQVDSLKLQLL